MVEWLGNYTLILQYRSECYPLTYYFRVQAICHHSLF